MMQKDEDAETEKEKAGGMGILVIANPGHKTSKEC